MIYAILGAGGIGYHLAEPLARLLAHPPEMVGDRIQNPTLFIIDGDEVEDHNLARQHGAAAIGQNKAEIMARTLRDTFPGLDVRVISMYLSDRLLNHHREWLVEGVTLFGCVDNNKTRCFLEEQLDKLDEFTWVDGGNDLDSGQAMLWRRINSEDVCASLTERNPEMRHETPGNEFPDQLDCTQEYETQPQLALANQAVAQAMLQTWFAQVLTIDDPMKPSFNTIVVDVLGGKAAPQTQHSLQLT